MCRRLPPLTEILLFPFALYTCRNDQLYNKLPNVIHTLYMDRFFINNNWELLEELEFCAWILDISKQCEIALQNMTAL